MPRCGASPRRSRPRSAPAICWPATAARSSPCSCPTSTATPAKEVAERLRRQVGERSGDDAPSCTLSVGVATLRGGETFPELVARADAALFRAKQAGRDRVSG